MLELKHVSKWYETKKKKQVQALKDVSLTFGNTGLYVIFGKSGSGKSTLLNLIAGLDGVTSGRILFNEEDVTKFKANELNQYRNFQIGFIFQELNLISNLNVKENIALSLKMQGKKASDEDILQVLTTVGMEAFMDRGINELSGGQKQRIAIARAIIKNPNMIVADEPTGSLDLETSEQIFSLLKKLSEKHLIIVVTHNEECAKKYADHLIYLKEGSVEKEERISLLENPTVWSNPSVRKNYLPFFTAFKIGLSNLKINIVRLCILIFLSALSFICLGVSITSFQYHKDDLIARAIAANDYVDPLTIISTYKRSESVWQQTTISPSFVNDLNQHLEGIYLGVFQDIGQSNVNFMSDIEIDYSNYDALSLYSLSGVAVIDSTILEKLGYHVYGNIPTQENEILITNYFYETFVRYGYAYHPDNMQATISEKEDMIGKIIQIPKYRHSDIMVEYKVCGMIDTKDDTSKYQELLTYQDDQAELNSDKRLFQYYQSNSIHSVGYLSQSGMDLIYKISDEKGQGYNCMVGQMPTDQKKLTSIVNYLEKAGDDRTRYQLINTTDAWIKDVDTLMQTYKMIGGIAGLVLMVFSGLLLFNYINLSISHKQKEMGILRALGARGIDIFKIFGCEGFLIGIINFILSVIGTNMLVFFINAGMKKEYFLNMDVYRFNFLSGFLLFLIGFLSCFFSIFIPILKVSKKPPIQTIRIEQ